MKVGWSQLHPIICPLPRDFIPDDTSHAEAKKWMNDATDEIQELRVLLTEFIEVMTPCDHWDHHGYCQTHNLHDRDDCPVMKATVALKGLEGHERQKK